MSGREETVMCIKRYFFTSLRNEFNFGENLCNSEEPEQRCQSGKAAGQLKPAESIPCHSENGILTDKRDCETDQCGKGSLDQILARNRYNNAESEDPQ